MVGVWKQETQEKGELNLGDTKVTSQQTLHKLWKKQFLIHIQSEPTNAARFSSHPHNSGGPKTLFLRRVFTF
ncbi:hypothetical protein M413DRAFT_439110 [Hebeloma cylindrosporum]|uniref:Uncharacterized protein n=1 Tax=Hebeloma cylindrosporum TaxID=76867 RepID=A0A0C3CU73_HEBCY|nr:hypothetical protein M413DRAFT_439110 [Hebeloma cylindrosporum h7]